VRSNEELVALTTDAVEVPLTDLWFELTPKERKIFFKQILPQALRNITRDLKEEAKFDE